ncbi:MAG: alpha-galactosidase [Clostridia bacterium]|nr:alpha-galactosidase [Clostridia bacterium]
MILKAKDNVFHLQTENTSYIIRVLPSGHLESVYYGRRIEATDDYTYLFHKLGCGYGNATAYSQKNKKFALDQTPLEYSTYGKGEYRLPAMQLQHEDGDFTSDFLFVKAEEVLKPKLRSMPSAYGDSQTLCVTLRDSALGADLELYYSVFEKADVITRSARLINNSSKNITINSMLSMQIDLPYGNYTMMTFDGAWIKERSKYEHKLNSGVCSVGSITGTSSNRHNPFFVIREDDATEDFGNCYGFNLVYSGNHIARTEVSTHGLLRVQNGINPFEFEWLLKAGESFDAPESVLTFSHKGLNGMSGNMHKFVKEHIVRGEWKYRERPILVNNWEATYFSFDEKKILSIAKTAKDLGAEMFVLDDGWFGKRNDDTTSLGDWYVNKKKLPSGIEGLSKKINKLGIKFGLWVEPEMISPDSDLYRAHPDWAITSDHYEPSQGRNQLILDLTRREVRDYLIETLTDVFRSGNIEYIKWDMNRQFTDVFSHRNGRRTGEIFHRYVLGLYDILDALTGKFPNILFESCSSGGNRFDLGMFCYMPQCWTSDNTDALDRIFIQSGTSYGYPQSVMTMHVAAATSFQCLRTSSVEHRFNVSAFGLLGYELDVTKMNKFDKVAVKRQIEFYKQHRKLLQFGTFYRIGDFFKEDIAKWQIVSDDKSESIMGYFVDRIRANGPNDVIRFRGLDESFRYRLTNRDQFINIKSLGELINAGPFTFDVEDGKLYEFLTNNIKIHTEKTDYVIGGESLMNSGFKPQQPFTGSGYNREIRPLLDTDSRIYILEKQEDKA